MTIKLRSEKAKGNGKSYAIDGLFYGV